MNSGLARIEPRGQGSICIWIGPHLITTFPVTERDYAEGLVTKINDHARRNNLPLTLQRRVEYIDSRVLALTGRNVDIANELHGLDETSDMAQESSRLHTELRENCVEITNFSIERETILFCVDAYGGNHREVIVEV